MLTNCFQINYFQLSVIFFENNLTNLAFVLFLLKTTFYTTKHLKKVSKNLIKTRNPDLN